MNTYAVLKGRCPPQTFPRLLIEVLGEGDDYQLCIEEERKTIGVVDSGANLGVWYDVESRELEIMVLVSWQEAENPTEAEEVARILRLGKTLGLGLRVAGVELL